MMILKEINSKEYEQWISQYPQRNFLQSSNEGRKMKQDGWDVHFVCGANGQDIQISAMVCLNPLMKVFTYAYIPRGPIYDLEKPELLEEFYPLLKGYLKKKKCAFLETDPYIALRQRDKNGALVEDGWNHFDLVEKYKSMGFEHLPLKQGYDMTKQCRWMSVLNLEDETSDKLFKSFPSKTRQNIKNTIKNQIKVRPLKREELSILHNIVSETGERRNFESLPLEYYQEQYDYFEDKATAYYAYLDIEDYIANIQENTKKNQEQLKNAEEGLKNNPHSKNSQSRLKSATQNLQSLEKRMKEAQALQEEHGKELGLAAAMFIYYGQEVIYLMSGSKDNYKKYKGPYALQWSVIQDAIQKGYKYYNFYGISGLFEPEDEGYGVFDFKRGFNADVVELVGNFILPVSPAVYKLFCLKQNRS